MSYSRWLLAVSVVSVVSCGPGRTMQVDRKPIAEFKVTQSTVRPQVFAFDAAASRPTVGTLAKYRWTFGDEGAGGAPTETPIATAQHAYKTAGTFTVTLVVLDDKDTESEPVSKQVTVAAVNNEGPMARITGPSSGMPNAMLTFDGSGSTPSGDIQNYVWNFDDGTTTSGKDKGIVQHAFTAARNHRVTLTVTDSLGQNATAEQQVVIGSGGPLAICNAMPTTPSQGAPVMFSGAQSTTPSGTMIQAYVWDFGDGVNNVPGMTVQHSYSMQGTFKPKLKVFDNSTPPKSHETFCPDIVVGAPALCVGDYTWRGMSSGLCSWSSTTIQVNQMANGMMTLTEPGPGGAPITYSGTWTGSTFTLTGSYGAQGVTYNVNISGTFSGCGSFTGSYTSTDDVIGFPCTSTISATKL
jgi:PKD repeat protein